VAQFAMVVTWGFVIASLIQAGRMYPFLPPKIPIHFGFRGEPDGWGSRGMIWLLPIISVLMVAFLSAIPLIPSDKPAPAGLLEALNLEMAALYFVILQGQIDVALGRRQRLGPQLWIVLLLVIVTPLPFLFRH
jgi:uncharacterized membrane protein